MNTEQRLQRTGLGAVVLLALWAPGASAQIVNETVTTGAELSVQVGQAGIQGGGDIRLDAVPPADGDFIVPGGLTITNNVRLRGLGDLPTEITINATNPSATGATILVETGGTLTLENLSVTSSGNFPAIRVNSGGTLVLERAMIENAGADGVRLVDDVNVTAPAVVEAASSIFHRNTGRAIHSETRNVEIYVLQCTFLGNTGGIRHGNNDDNGSGFIEVAASIFDDTGEPLGSANPAVDMRSFANYFDVSVGANVVIVEDSITDPPAFEEDNPLFPGNVTDPLLSGIGLAQLPEAFVDRIRDIFPRDFKKLPRNILNLHAGADEVGGLTGPLWLDVAFYDGNVPDLYFGPNKPARVEVIVNQIDLEGGALIVVPQLGDLTNPDAQIIVLGFDALVPGERYATTLTVPPTFSLPDPTVPVDGRATVYLQDGNGDVYGLDTATLGPGLIDNVNRRQLVLDTIPPVLFTSNSRREELIVFSPQDRPVPGALPGTPFPGGWEPGFEPIPRSAATFAGVNAGTPRAFVNADPGAVMELTVGVRFVDLLPELIDGTVFPVEQSGFMNFSQPGVDVSTVSGRAQVYDAPPVADGIGYLQTTSNAINTGAVSVTNLPDFDDAGRAVVDTRWTFSDQGYTSNPVWRRDFQFEARDRAGNVTAVNTGVAEVYWLVNPVPNVSGPPSGVETSSPEFGWIIRENNQPPPVTANTAPSQPIVRVSLWRATDVSLQTWVPVMPWSRFVSAATINRNTVLFPNGGTLGAFLDLPESQGQVMELVFQAADQAGNISALNSDLLSLNPTDGINMPGGGQWTTPGFAATVDTSLQAFFWYNRVDRGNTLRERDASEPYFGAATRIPLPSLEDCLFRIEGKFTIGFQLSDLQPPDNLDAFSDFRLLEDGRVVAQGRILNPAPHSPTVNLVIPHDLISPGLSEFPIDPLQVSDFLNDPPLDGCAGVMGFPDRLGDEGNPADFRQRDVSYTLVVQNGYDTGQEDPNGDPIERLDATPASFTWVVSVDTELGDEQPIKSFGQD